MAVLFHQRDQTKHRQLGILFRLDVWVKKNLTTIPKDTTGAQMTAVIASSVTNTFSALKMFLWILDVIFNDFSRYSS